MGIMLLVHVGAGGLGLLFGYVALYAGKGARVHRRSGLLFVISMLVMSLTAVVIAATHGVESSVIAGLSTAYLVTTAFTTVHPFPGSHRVDIGAMFLGLATGMTSVAWGLELIVGGGTRDGLPAFPFFILGLPALLGSLSDIRLMRSGPLRGAARLARHLWRMCYALLIAAMSFFLGQARVIPEAIRIPVLLALPVIAVLLAMLYWLWRVRVRQGTLRIGGAIDAGAIGPASP